MVKNENKIPFQKTRISNSIVIGGMIAFGKSTLAQQLLKHYKNAVFIPELDPQDDLWPLLLKKMYQRDNDNLYASLFQLYFMIKRFDRYKDAIRKHEFTIFDRSVFEDWLFAKENLNNPFLFNYYEGTFLGICNQTIYHYGIPKLYVILDGDWELFKERLFKRNRQVEIENFQKNEIYFHRLLNQYTSFLVDTCKNFGIEYIVVDAKLPAETKIKMVVDKLNEINNRKKEY